MSDFFAALRAFQWLAINFTFQRWRILLIKPAAVVAPALEPTRVIQCQSVQPSELGGAPRSLWKMASKTIAPALDPISGSLRARGLLTRISGGGHRSSRARRAASSIPSCSHPCEG
jgi:hypothetical protein